MTRAATRALVRAIGLAAALLSPLPAASQTLDVPYVRTPWNVVDAMLKIAEVGPQDFLVDLGSGDGRIVIAAAKQHGARGLGVDLDGALVNAARNEARRQGVAGRVEFYAENLFITDISRATVVTMYLLPSVNLQLRPRLFSDLRPGTRVVSHDFDMGDWKPDARASVAVPDKPHGAPVSEVFLWVMPASAAGTWECRVALGETPVTYELALRQSFQMLAGSVHVGGKPGRFEGGRMRGERIGFVLTAEVRGRSVRHEFDGRVAGDTASGKVRLAGGGEADWSATRVKRGEIRLSSEE